MKKRTYLPGQCSAPYAKESLALPSLLLYVQDKLVWRVNKKRRVAPAASTATRADLPGRMQP